MGRGWERYRLHVSSLFGLALLAGCRVAPLGGPPSSSPTQPLDLSIATETAQSPPPPRPTTLREPAQAPLGQRLEVPPEIPGSSMQPFQLPPADPEHKAER